MNLGRSFNRDPILYLFVEGYLMNDRIRNYFITQSFDNILMYVIFFLSQENHKEILNRTLGSIHGKTTVFYIAINLTLRNLIQFPTPFLVIILILNFFQTMGINLHLRRQIIDQQIQYLEIIHK